jgi:hypothetical protein
MSLMPCPSKTVRKDEEGTRRQRGKQKALPDKRLHHEENQEDGGRRQERKNKFVS